MAYENKTAMAPEIILPEPKPHLIPLTQWPKYHPWPPLGGLRHLVFHAERNGFSKVFIRSRGRILIDEKKFFEFINENHSDMPKPRKRKAVR